MPQFIKIRGAYFNNPDLPVLTDLRAAIAALPGLAGWVNANENNYYTDVNGYLALRDLSPAGADFVRPSGQAAVPSILPNGLNGYPVIVFNGVSGNTDRLKRAVSDVPTGGAAEFSFACVAKRDVVDASNNLFMSTSVGSTGLTLYSPASGGAVWFGGAGGASNVVLDDTDWQIMIGSITNGRDIKFLNPVNLSAVASASMDHDNGSAALYIGGHDGAASFLNGQVAEVIYTVSDLLNAANASHLENLLNYFQSKYKL